MGTQLILMIDNAWKGLILPSQDMDHTRLLLMIDSGWNDCVRPQSGWVRPVVHPDRLKQAPRKSLPDP
jgi:hypothetical protein